jgi:hypothetical protein
MKKTTTTDDDIHDRNRAAAGYPNNFGPLSELPEVEKPAENDTKEAS